FTSIPFVVVEQPSSRRSARKASASRPIRLILEDDLPVVRAADAGGRSRQYLVLVNRVIDWVRHNVGDLLIAALTLGTVLELAFTSVDYKPAVIPVALV